MKKILITGGCGYIGSHTIVDLIQNGYEIISVDNFSKSDPYILTAIENIVGKKIKNYTIDLCDYDATLSVFEENKGIDGIIHFAAYKLVTESEMNPIDYYENNLKSMLNVLKCASNFKINHFVFSSSCTVYGNPDVFPVTEEAPLLQAQSVYGATKQMGEQIIKDIAKSTNLQAILLRYFNPVGAHLSNLIGEMPFGKPQNLVPIITQTAMGKLPTMQVCGNDYPTIDGTCVRDFIHVSDIAHAHTLALNNLIQKKNKSNCDVFNLGTGKGYSVLEVINAFENTNNLKLNYTFGPRRNGDVIAIYANNEKAKNILGWIPKYDLNTMMKTAWDWEKKLATLS